MSEKLYLISNIYGGQAVAFRQRRGKVHLRDESFP